MVLTFRQKIIAYNKWLGTHQVIDQRFNALQSARTMENKLNASLANERVREGRKEG